jgi:hypothetical protein
MSWWDKYVKLQATYNPTVWGLYALGGGINTLTGGDTATYWAPAAVKDSTGTTYSNVTQALSGYQGDTPGSGSWGLPIVNPATAQVAWDVVNRALEPVALDAKKLLLIAGVVAAVAVMR